MQQGARRPAPSSSGRRGSASGPATAAGSAPAPASAATGIVGRRAGLQITAASIGGALAGYVVLAVVARSVSLEENTVFVTFWSALLTMYGVLTGINTETARAVAQAGMTAGQPGAGGAPRGTVARAVAVVAGLVLVVGLGLALTGVHVFPAGHDVLAVVVALSAAAYAVQATLLGSLSGRASWSAYAGLLGLEAGLRVVVVAATAAVIASVASVAVAAGSAAAVWLLMLAFSRSVRRAFRAQLDAPLTTYLGRAGIAATASGASAILLVGFPVLVSLTTEPSVFETAAPLMLAITLTRAPIMVPLTSFQSVIVAQFVRNTDRAGRTLIRAVGALGALGLVGAVGAYLVGPWLMVVLFGPEYRVSGAVLAAMTAASVGTAIITITAALSQALRRQVGFVAGWLVALTVTILFLLSGWNLETRLLGALLAAPYCGVLVHLVVIRRALQRQGRTPVSSDAR